MIMMTTIKITDDIGDGDDNDSDDDGGDDDCLCPLS